MSIELNILTTGVSALEKAANTFTKLAQSMTATDGASKKVSTGAAKQAREYEKLAVTLTHLASQFTKIEKAMQQASASATSLERLNVPFTKLSSQIGKVRHDVGALNKDLRALNAESAIKLDNSSFMSLTRNYKANLLLQQQLNAEIEKQAKLTAEIAMLNPKKNKNDVTRGSAENLEKAIAQTKKLREEYDRLTISKRKALAQQGYARDAMKGEGAAANLIGIQKMGATETRALKAQMLQAAAAQDKMTSAQEKYAQAAMTGVSASERLIGVQKMGTSESKALQKQMLAEAAAQGERLTAQQKYAQGAMKGVGAAEKLIGVQRMGTEQAARLKTQMLESAGAREKQIAAQQKYAQEAMKGVAAAEKLVGVQKMGESASKALQKQMEAEAAAIKIATEAKRAYAQEAMKGATAARKLIGTDKYDRETGSNLKRQMEDQAALDKLKRKLESLKSVRLPEAEFKRLQAAIRAANAELIKTGKVHSGDLSKLNTELMGLERGFTKSGKAAKNWSGNMKYAIGGVARSMGAMTYSYAALAPLLAGIAVGSAVKNVYSLGTAFEYTTTYVDALGDSLSKVDASAIQEQLLSFETMRKGPIEMADGMKEFAKAGVEATNSMGQLQEMTKFATIAEMELGEAVKLVIGQSNAFNQSFSESANMIASAALSSATDIKEMATALSYTTELATVSKTTFDEVATALALMANKGIKSSKAGTAVRTSMLKMQAPSEKLKRSLDALGISWTAFTEDGKIKNMRTMFTELKRVTDNLPDAERIPILKELFGLRALKGGANILNSMGEEWDKMNAKIRDSSSAITFIQEKYDALEDTVKAKGEKLRTEFQKSLIKAFESEDIKQVLDNLRAAVASESFIDGMGSVVAGMNSIGMALTDLIALGGKIPGDMVDHGIASLILFGKGGPVSWAAAAALALKKAGDGLDYLKNQQMGQVAENIALPELEFSAEKLSSDAGVKLLEERLAKLKELRQAQAEVQIDFSRFQKALGALKLGAPSGALFELTRRGTPVDEYVKSLEEGKEKLIVEGKDVTAEIRKIEKAIEGISLDVARKKGRTEVLRDLEDELAKAIGEKDLVLQASVKLRIEQTKLGNEQDFGLTPLINETKKRVAEAQKELETALTIENLNVELGIEYTKEMFDFFTMGEEAMRSYRDELQKLDQEAALAEAGGLEKFRLKIRLLAEEWGEGLGLAAGHGAVKKMADEMEDAQRRINIAGLNEEIEQMKFDTMINGLNESGSAAKQLEGEFEKLKRQLKEKLELKGITLDSDKGQEYFSSLIENAGLFEDAIKSAEDKVRDLQNTIADTEFGFAEDLFKERQKLNPKGTDDKAQTYRYQLQQIKELEAAAEKAGAAGEEGQKRKLELLKQAYNIAKGMDTTADSGAAAKKMQQAQKEWQKYDARGWATQANQAAKQYLEAREKYLRAKSGAVDKDMQNQKIDKMSAIQKKILELQKADEAKAQKEQENIKKFVEEAKKSWGVVEEVTKKASETSEAYGVVVKENSDGITAWSQIANEAIKSVTVAQRELNKAAAAYKPPKIPSGVDGARAAGGPVTGGNTYLVGERGPELFSPKASGFITPNHELRQSNSKDSVDINLFIGNSEPIPVRGDQTTLDRIEKARKEQQRYAA